MSKPTASFKSKSANTFVDYWVENDGVHFIFNKGIFGMLDYEKTDWRTKSKAEVEQAIEQAIKDEFYSFF